MLCTELSRRLEAYREINDLFGFLTDFSTKSDAEIRQACTKFKEHYFEDIEPEFIDEMVQYKYFLLQLEDARKKTMPAEESYKLIIEADGPRPGEKDLIDMMNDLQTKLVANGYSLDLSLPQIVVVGAQSAGKSSVLENIVGREFLPRGSGVVTRRPTLIQLYPCQGEEYAIFGHKENEKFTNFNDVKSEIAAQMPPRHKFSSVPIQVKIYSPRVLKLTLVDLPGLVRVVVDGQPESSILEVRDMVLSYIKQPESLILAVSPANQDLATSDALEIARTVDPQRLRTIGVLTKLDLMDEGTDARDVLENRQVTLKRGKAFIYFSF
ncbi:dynamin-2 [Trichonephila clavata]|uniref:Dynamin-2 n=1 Tax=Trichonephila clavata TaxID=2740835 RepID=A0A8X6KGU3_TRICU|nr:dynamin-2 [Trichonephila clavata]